MESKDEKRTIGIFEFTAIPYGEDPISLGDYVLVSNPETGKEIIAIVGGTNENTTTVFNAENTSELYKIPTCEVTTRAAVDMPWMAI